MNHLSEELHVVQQLLLLSGYLSLKNMLETQHIKNLLWFTSGFFLNDKLFQFYKKYVTLICLTVLTCL